MKLRMIMQKVTDLSGKELAARRNLSSAVYPPDVVANWPGRSIEWASPEWCVMCWDEKGEALSHAGVLIRECEIDGSPVRIGGIGGLMTHPKARREGLATKVIKGSLEFFLERAVDFALLVCKRELVPLYEKLGWQLYRDKVLVTQKGVTTPFTFNLPMVHSACKAAPSSGDIYLKGAPW